MPKTVVLRYLLIGGVAYVCEMATLYGLHHVIGLGAVGSVAISFWLGLIVAFVLQKLVTFQNYERKVHIVAKQVLGYAVLVAWNYIFTLLMTRGLDGHISVYVIRTVTIIITTSWNFLIYKQLFKLPDITHG